MPLLKKSIKKALMSTFRQFSSIICRVSHIMPALNLALNVDFEKKSIKKALLSTFRALFALLQTETAERLVKTWTKPDECNCFLWKAIFSSSSVLVHCLVVVDHCSRLVRINIGQCCNKHWRPLCFWSLIQVPCFVDCDVHWGFTRCCRTDKRDVMPYVQWMVNNRVNIMDICSIFILYCVTLQRTLVCCLALKCLYTLSSFFQWRHPLLHDQLPSHNDSVCKASRLSASSKVHITAMLSTTQHPLVSPRRCF